MRNRILLAGAVVVVLSAMCCAAAQTVVPTRAGTTPTDPKATAHKGGNAVMERLLQEGTGGVSAGLWTADEALLLDGVIAEWRVSGDGRLFAYVQAAVDRSVDANGEIRVREGVAYPVEAHSLDNIAMGRSVLTMYRVLQQPRYYKAAKFLRDQMQQQPRSASGAYWEGQAYPNQMWAEGAYFAEPFLENYGKTFDHPKEMDEVATQLLVMDAKLESRPRNRGSVSMVVENTSGQLHQGWDESRKTDWSDAKTGLSAEMWSRGMGIYAMAVVDVLERMSSSDPQRAAMEAVARRVLQAIVRYQDSETGLWWQVMDKGTQKGNFLESSASCMFVYSLAKGIRLGLLGQGVGQNVTRGWEGIEKHFVKADGTLAGTARGGGLGKGAGDEPYRDGTFASYTHETVVDNDPKGVGAYLLALSEMTQRKRAGELMRRAAGKTVLFDAWFNSQTRKTADGNTEFYRYKTTDDSNSGYSFWARMFQQYGLRTEQLDHAPRAEDLKEVEIYVIASPDNVATNLNAHFMDKTSAEAIDAWVKAGGTLVLMENDSEHADQTYLDLLSDKFGLHFNPVVRNAGEDDANTLVAIPAGAGGIFHHAHEALMKETSTLTVSGPAKAVVTEKSDTFMAVAHVGRGVVFGNVDPWLYNEYVDGRKDPLDEDNFAAGQELTHWLVNEAVGR